MLLHGRALLNVAHALDRGLHLLLVYDLALHGVALLLHVEHPATLALGRMVHGERMALLEDAHVLLGVCFLDNLACRNRRNNGLLLDDRLALLLGANMTLVDDARVLLHDAPLALAQRALLALHLGLLARLAD